MLSYQHIYHAANFADVQKHALLAQVLKSLCARPAPLFVIDTHAGRGIYALGDDEAQKNREYENGIMSFWAAREAAPAALKPWLESIATLNPQGELTRYPGSAMLAKRMLRGNDRLVAVERHPGEYGYLQQALAELAPLMPAPKTKALQDDGLRLLEDFIPAPERRALAVIDPSYEMKSDYAEVPKAIIRALKKMPQLCVFLWYPLLQSGAQREMLSAFVKSGLRDTLVSEIRLEAAPQEHYRMTGSGILIVNPPWPDAVMNDITQAIATRLPAKAYGDVFWLDNCRIDPDTGLMVI